MKTNVSTTKRQFTINTVPQHATLLTVLYGHKPFYGDATSSATANGSANNIP